MTIMRFADVRIEQAYKGNLHHNSAFLPFIKNVWNIQEAMNNSDSLTRMVRRLEKLAADNSTL